MSDTISREALITVMETLCDESKPLDVLIRNVSVAAIKKAPAVDAVEVVRCKDCKYFEQITSGMLRGNYCNNTFWNHEESIEVEPNDFCSYGERKEASE